MRRSNLWRSVALCAATGTAAASRLIWLSAKYYLYSHRAARVELRGTVSNPYRFGGAPRSKGETHGRAVLSARRSFSRPIDGRDRCVRARARILRWCDPRGCRPPIGFRGAVEGERSSHRSRAATLSRISPGAREGNTRGECIFNVCAKARHFAFT